MHWIEDESPTRVAPDVVDVSFRIGCRSLPVDHALALRNALLDAFPWLSSEPFAAVHSIHGAASGNGWMRPPDQAGAFLDLPRRTRLYLRIPAHRLEDTATLADTALNVGGTSMRLSAQRVRPLFATETVFARSVPNPRGLDEAAFTRRLIEDLSRLDVRVKKLLCGLEHTVQGADGPLRARSVMIADLEVEESLALQQHGVGEHALLGCGIFLPHKSIAAVGGP